jgi:hypothetical protein
MVCGSVKRAAPHCSCVMTPWASILSRSAVRARLVDDLAHAPQHPVVIQHRRLHRDAVLRQLARFAEEPGGVGQDEDRDGPVVGGHPSELAAGHDLGARPAPRPERRQ